MYKHYFLKGLIMKQISLKNIESTFPVQTGPQYNFILLKKILTHKTVIFTLSLFIVFLLLFVTLETTLRKTHLFGARVSASMPDPILKWRFTPNHSYWFFQENDHPITGKFNSFGWRDHEWALAKAPNTFRIAVLGDSFVEAFQVESDRTFTEIIEQEINKNSNTKIELMNFGRSGFTQTEELIVLKNEVIQFDPDMVILFFLPDNDIQDVSRETAYGSRPFYLVDKSGGLILDTSFSGTKEYKIRSIINHVKQRSAFVSLLAERYNTMKQQLNKKKFQDNDKVQKGINGFLSLCTSNPDQKYVRSYQLNKRLIKEIAEYTEGKGIQFMLATISTAAYKPEIEQEYISIDPSYNANFFEDDLKDLADTLNIDYIGLQRPFRQSYEKTGESLYWGHWNYKGHEVVADILSDKLKGIIPENTLYTGLTVQAFQ